MLKTVEVKRMRPNPFRRLEEYPILREKVDALKESIDQTGFWGTIVGREMDNGMIEIAFGHHRMAAIQELDIAMVEIIVRDLTNEDMLKMMARENMEEWGTSAWVELETIRTTIDAFSKGLITLPKVPRNAPEKRELQGVSQGVGSLFYTPASVAEFLGWTRKNHENGVRPNFACETAFDAIDMIDAGLLKESDVVGLKRTQLADTLKGMRAIRDSQEREARQNRENAKHARERALAATAEKERQRQIEQAEVYAEQAAMAERAAEDKPKRFAKDAGNLFREGKGRPAVKTRADELKAVVERPAKIHSVDDLADKIARKLEDFADNKDLKGDVNWLKASIADASPDAIRRLNQSFTKVIDALQRMQRKFTNTSSHVDATEGSRNGTRAIIDSRK